MLSRLETMVLMAGMELPVKAIREQIASAIDLIVQTSRLRDGSRKIIQVTEVQGMEGDVITLQDIFSFEQQGVDEQGKIFGQLLSHRYSAQVHGPAGGCWHLAESRAFRRLLGGSTMFWALIAFVGVTGLVYLLLIIKSDESRIQRRFERAATAPWLRLQLRARQSRRSRRRGLAEGRATGVNSSPWTQGVNWSCGCIGRGYP